MKLNPLVGLAALQNDKIGAFRAWVVARNLDPEGSGRAARREVFAYLAGMGAIARTRQRWARQAVELGLLTTDRKKRHFYYAGEGKAAAIFKAPDIGRSVILDNPRLLFQRETVGGALWAGFLESLGRDCPTSRETLSDLSGVPVRTQRFYEGQIDAVDVIPCYADVGEIPKGASPRDWIREYRHLAGGAFQVSGNRIVQRLPNVYSVSGFNQCRNGRRNKSRKELTDLLNVQQVNDSPERIYYKSVKSAKKAANGTPKFGFLRHVRGVNLFILAI